MTKSSNNCLWPILCSDIRIKKVYLIGAYQGNEKASDSNLFLSKFVIEINPLILNTYYYKNYKFKIKVHALICDAPVKSLVLHTKGHTGYNSYSKCVIKGEYVNGRICFPIELDKNKIIQLDDLRTDFDFSNKLYLNSYQQSDSILSSLHNFGMVKNVALDYMHLVCVGVVKKLIILWREGPLRTRIPFRDIKCISDYNIFLKTSTPNDFPRKPRSLLDIKHWKLAEFRTFLLYTSPIVLKKYLFDEMYTIFLFLHVAISILINPDLVKSNNYINYANNLLKHFVLHFQNIYGKEFVSHNIHSLIRLAEDVRTYDALDVFGAFRFENHMEKLKKMIRKADKPLQQLAKRFSELENIESNRKYLNNKSKLTNFVHLQNKHTKGPLTQFDIFNLPINQYKKIIIQDKLSIHCDTKIVFAF